jgi:protein-tyrosine phosphatase
MSRSSFVGRLKNGAINRVAAFALLAAAVLSAGCASRAQRLDPAEVDAPSVERVMIERIDHEKVRIRWPADFSTGSVSVFTGPHPNDIDRMKPVAVGSGSEIVVDDLDDDVPHYLELVPEGGGVSIVTSERRLPLQGALNFRDLGGYLTSDGRRVRWGRMFRADSLADLTPRDLKYLSALDIQLICDFRSEQERSDDPSRYDSGSLNILNLPVTAEGVDPSLMRRKIRTGGVVQLELERTMQTSYRLFVNAFSDDWAAMFRFLSEAKNLPAVVHCTKGKDRTGFASALVLLALGVPQETVFEDYLLSNQYLAGFRSFVLRWVPLYSFFRTDPGDLLPLLEARRAYLQGSLDAIVELYGSVDNYLERQLGVTPARREQLRANLLTPPLSAADPRSLDEVAAKDPPGPFDQAPTNP